MEEDADYARDWTAASQANASKHLVIEDDCAFKNMDDRVEGKTCSRSNPLMRASLQVRTTRMTDRLVMSRRRTRPQRITTGLMKRFVIRSAR